MGELVPSVLLYGQAISLLQELREAQETGAVKDTFDLVEQLAAILTAFQDGAGRPLIDYERVVETEPPLSEKSNKFWNRAEKDVNLLQGQVDVLLASSIFSYNLTTTGVLQSRQENARLNNKLKSLQMYSTSHQPNVILFGDSFKNFDFVDFTRTPVEERVSLFHQGHVTLGRHGGLVNLSEDADIEVISSSNGFLGNNQEVENPEEAPIDPETGAASYTFKAELRNYDDLSNIVDDEPNTWIEYERYLLSETVKRSALGFNFVYKKIDENDNIERVDWATAPDRGILRLGLEFDFKRIKNLNSIEYLPYGLEENKNYPVLIKQITTSPNGTDWTNVFPTNVWVGTDLNLKTARTADNIITEKALWAFEARAVRYVKIFIEQHHPVDSHVGHPYWVERRDPDTRVEGPIPFEDNPTEYYNQRMVGEYIQMREVFPGKRWAIGIRDILMQQVEYKAKSTLVTRPFRVDGLIDRVVLEDVEVQIPVEYPPDDVWVKFYVTPDDGENWFPISRIEDDFNGLPEQISFNDPIHESLRERSVVNHDVDRPVSSIRLKIELHRPPDLRETTPVLKSYKLKVLIR